MSFFKTLTEESHRELIALKTTKTITDEDLILPEWKFLKAEYVANQTSSWETRALVSLTNSIFHQKRAFFVLARRPFRDLCKSDKNWKKPIGLKDENWKLFILTATTSGLINKVHTGAKGRLVFQVIHPDLVRLLTIDLEEQRKEAIEFSENTSESDEDLAEGNQTGNHQGNREVEIEVESELIDKNPIIEDRGKDGININLLDSTKATPNAGSIPPELPKNAPQISGRPSQDEIIHAWLSTFDRPLDGLQHKNAAQNLANLVATFKNYNYESPEIPVKRVTEIAFGPSSTMGEWINQTEIRLSKAIASAYGNVQVVTALSSSGVVFHSPEAKAKYDQFIAKGMTSADCGGMSLVEYAHQRAHAESFDIIDFDSLEEPEHS